jgi:hypothetical protein
MNRSVYFYAQDLPGLSQGPRALITVPLFNGKLPPVVEWRRITYYWDEQKGGYRSWLMTDDVHKVPDEAVLKSFGQTNG